MRRALILSLLLALSASALTHPHRDHRPFTRKAAPESTMLDPRAQVLWNAYLRAIYDSSVYEITNVRKLHPLVPDANGNVRVGTLTAKDGEVGGTIEVDAGGIWVTAVDELQPLCRSFSGDVLMQLRQLIGLPPDADIPRLLIFTPPVTAIFRPSPDESTSTTLPCAPATENDTIPQNCGNVFSTMTTPEHYEWMAISFASLHSVPDGYPWTHLGYTYNWKPGADRYGASEYIIRPGTDVVIVEKTTPEDFCKPVPSP